MDSFNVVDPSGLEESGAYDEATDTTYANDVLIVGGGDDELADLLAYAEYADQMAEAEKGPRFGPS